MSRRRNLWSGLAAVGIAVALVAGVRYAPGHAPAGSLSVSAAPTVTDQLQDAGLVDGSTINTAAVRKLLAEIPNATAATAGGYDRDSFGPAWADSDRNGCDQRNDVLTRDLTAVTYKPGTHDCVVLSGTLADPYTGHEMSFTRGSKTSTAVQIDHMVPLSWAYQHGASTWTEQRREQLATDLNNLTAVDGPSNESKSDQGPATWLPPEASYACTYVTRFTYVVHRYELTIDTADRAVITRTLTTCK
ncbi:HNH endonuclease family protein [Curtobacterium flaccumfaciens pv. oortii]|uniref:HNH endonuclease family protein n=1 Tax=Curtobacterium flaccumfaciens TaxID=2035 RepID=UPI002657FEF0|nr:HNH endonuclease family protein [Curtobacterium flaccumfaciens]MCS5524798.1 HNH endonuclease family protein [Curtobacterium flaccumfaciens pv. oortii]